VGVEARGLGGDDEDQLAAAAGRLLGGSGRDQQRDEGERGQERFHGRHYTGAHENDRRAPRGRHRRRGGRGHVRAPDPPRPAPPPPPAPPAPPPRPPRPP